ncbi:MAG: superoxide dismutase [Candidatus Glassbacteria bacterium]|nr:superoxide dismutase [Candidatus Glassbacteria bacterium]
MKKALVFAALLGLYLAQPPLLLPHCEIPCGIYDDHLRSHLIEEHIATIEKSMKQIVELSAAGEKNYNQIVRWVVNKEEHADELQHVVSQYFLHQRIKPVDPTDAAQYKDYLHKLELLHRMLVAAMKAKQGTDLAQVDDLRRLLKEFNLAYFGEQ